MKINSKTLYIGLFPLLLLTNCREKSNHEADTDSLEFLAETDSIALYRGTINPAKDEYDSAEFTLWMEKNHQGKKRKFLELFVLIGIAGI